MFPTPWRPSPSLPIRALLHPAPAPPPNRRAQSQRRFPGRRRTPTSSGRWPGPASPTPARPPPPPPPPPQGPGQRSRNRTKHTRQAGRARSGEDGTARGQLHPGDPAARPGAATRHPAARQPGAGAGSGRGHETRESALEEMGRMIGDGRIGDPHDRRWANPHWRRWAHSAQGSAQKQRDNRPRRHRARAHARTRTLTVWSVEPVSSRAPATATAHTCAPQAHLPNTLAQSAETQAKAQKHVGVHTRMSNWGPPQSALAIHTKPGRADRQANRTRSLARSHARARRTHARTHARSLARARTMSVWPSSIPSQRPVAMSHICPPRPGVDGHRQPPQPGTAGP